MARTTITEALAEIKTIHKRLEKKREFIGAHLARNENIRDPFLKDGGSEQLIMQEMQSVRDLTKRHVRIRLAIAEANQRIMVTVGDNTASIAEWLVWRREIAPHGQLFLSRMARGLADIRRQAQQKGMTIGVGAGVQVGGEKPPDIIVNLNEKNLSEEIERLELILGELDGQLSLKNATETIEIP